MKVNTIIMAAGQGTRMVSSLPKVLHTVNGKPLILYSIEAARAAGSDRPVVVIGNGAEEVKQKVGEGAHFVLQEKRLGTAHAVMAVESLLKDESGLVLVIAGDMPLLTPDTLKSMIQKQEKNLGPLTMLTVRSNNPRGFGRILRDGDGKIAAIVEEAQASQEQLMIDELNVGAYCFNSD